VFPYLSALENAFGILRRFANVQVYFTSTLLAISAVAEPCFSPVTWTFEFEVDSKQNEPT